MKKILVLIGIVVILLVISLGGCSSGAPADYEAVKSSITAIQSDLTAAKAELATAKSDLATAKADLAKANTEIASTKALVTGMTPQIAGLSAMSAYSVWYDQYYGIFDYQFANTDTFKKELGALITTSNNAAAKTAWDKYLSSSNITNLGDVGTALYDAAQYTVTQYSTLLLQYQVANVSLKTAYDYWYDQYYNYGTTSQMYTFTDGTVFNTRIGDLITAANNSAVQTAWDAYLVTDTALADLLAALPTDYNTWTTDQTSQWTDATNARTTALGEVGTALYAAISG